MLAGTLGMPLESRVENFINKEELESRKKLNSFFILWFREKLRWKTEE